jgi:two-component sensor histidine kinase/CheY-like chemotaxis protein
VLFRSELIRSVRCAGDPHKPVEYGPNGPRLTPRESFAEWKELVRGRSQPFTPSETRVAETLRATLIEVVLRLADDATTERQAAGARQELLIAELNHRVRNILGVIRGLIRQSVSDDDRVQEFVRLVDGRIHALARAHNQITQDHWGPAFLQALIDAETSAFLVNEERVISSGTPVMLNPQAFSTMALVLHELVTNSAKYGSLSQVGGLAHIEWERKSGGDLDIRWRETGGPAVKKPKRQGFGTTIIERSVPYDLGGTARIEYRADGVEAHFCIPKRHVSDPPENRGEPALSIQRPAPGHPQEAPPNVLAGHNVLLVEDSLIIAIDAEDTLRKLGADDVTTAASVEAAFDLIEGAPPTIGILDINLGYGDSFPVADRLLELGVPFVFATGYGEQAQIPTQHHGRAVIQKPYTLEIVARAVANLLATGM